MISQDERKIFEVAFQRLKAQVKALTVNSKKAFVHQNRDELQSKFFAATTVENVLSRKA